MKKSCLFICVFLLLVGCSQPSGEPHIKGTVFIIDRQEKKILVVEGMTKEETSMSLRDAVDSDKFKRMTWFKGMGTKKYKVGDIVEVWANSSDDSYPGQSKATYVKKINDQ